MGLAAAVTVCYAILLALTMTPALLLSFPRAQLVQKLIACAARKACGGLSRPPPAAR